MISEKKAFNPIATPLVNEILKGDDFVVLQYKTDCLAEFAYYVESEGESAIIDPMRDVQTYINTVSDRKTKLKFIFETHCHADFISGHLDLSKKSGAKIVFGPGATVNFPFHETKDNEELAVGKIKLRVLHTPGHTPESSSFLLVDSEGKNKAVFTGDTLFLGDVGRPDLAASQNITREDLAGLLYDSLRDKIMTLEHDVTILPGHGSGSSCGRAIGKGNSCTIGRQLAANYALQPMTKEEFVKALTTDIPAAPQYFFFDAKKNREVIDPIDDIIARNNKPLSVQEFKKHQDSGAVVLDTRDNELLLKESIPGSIGITLKGTFANWVGTLIRPDSPIILIVNEGESYEAIMRLSRIGYEKVLGYLEGGVSEWVNSGLPVRTIGAITAADLKNLLSSNPYILDVRKRNEVADGAVDGANWIELVHLETDREKVPKDRTVYVNCQSGARSTIASTILSKHGFNNIINVTGGFKAMYDAGFPVKPIK